MASAVYGALASALRKVWGNRNYTAGEVYLLRLCHEAARCSPEHMIVECGSGLTTLVLAQIVPESRLLVLEHDADWCARTKYIVGLNGSVVHAPLVQHNGYQWYETPDLGGRKIGLLVCDGPPGNTEGGRWGALPQLHGHMAEDFTILLDDTNRSVERAVAEEWARQYGLSVTFEDDGDKEFAVLRGKA